MILFLSVAEKAQNREEDEEDSEEDSSGESEGESSEEPSEESSDECEDGWWKVLLWFNLHIFSLLYSMEI